MASLQMVEAPADDGLDCLPAAWLVRPDSSSVLEPPGFNSLPPDFHALRYALHQDHPSAGLQNHDAGIGMSDRKPCGWLQHPHTLTSVAIPAALSYNSSLASGQSRMIETPQDS